MVAMPSPPSTLRKPPWLKIRPPSGERYAAVKSRMRGLNLNTVCEEARCPNVGECWGQGTATFMLLGEICTRGCRFCAVRSSREGEALDPNEPQHVAEAVASMQLDYVVLTSVDRDDLPDGGAGHFAATVNAIRRRVPAAHVEVLIPDFAGQAAALDLLLASRPDVLAHNIEVVRRLTPTVRDARCDYDLSLSVLRMSKMRRPELLTKSSIMIGLGESDEEVLASLADLRAAGVDIVTLGQYLRPSVKHAAVVEYSPPKRFARLGEAAREAGFLYVASGPLVRSSYRAAELFVKGHAGGRAKEQGES